MVKTMKIDNATIEPGETKTVTYDIARLPSGMMINMPIHVYRSKVDGPVLLLSGGLHGDEVNGIETIRRMISEKLFDNIIAGTVIAVPILNLFGFLNHARDVPDGKDVNRSFPGSATGSLASRVAYRLTKNILPLIDYGIDFHTGGAQRTNYPQVRFSSVDKNSKLIADAFGAPYTLNSNLIPKSLRHQSSKMGKPIIVYEGGESLRIDEFSIEEAIEGSKRVMCYLGMLNEKFEPKESIFCKDTTWVRAQRSGIFKPFIVSGESVQKGQPIGVINDPFGEYEIKIIANATGHMIGHNNTPVVLQGDALFHIGIEK